MYASAFSTGNEVDVTALLEKYLNITITTDQIEPFIPGLVAKYGNNTPVAIANKFIDKASVCHFTTTGATTTINALFDFTIKGENAIHASISGS